MKNAVSYPSYLRLYSLATIVPVAVMFMAMWLKPMWRDEYWSLFFSDASVDFASLFQGRLRDEVHPPLYYFFLHYWRQLFGGVFGMRLLSIFMLGITSLALLKMTPNDRKQHLKVFLLVCLGSYWVIYFVSEIRPYIMLFCLVTLSVFMIPRFLQANEPQKKYYALWALCGAALGLTHYFGGLWFASAALVTAISAWQAGHRHRFYVIGVVSVIAIFPVIGWLLWSFPVLDLSDEQSARSVFEKFEFASNQYFRGLIVKTLGSNPLITFLGFSGVTAAFRLKQRVYSTLLFSIILTSALAFILHFTFVELIKERAFIVIMPAILYIFSSEIVKRQMKATKYLPIVTVIMPVLFLGEYLKNREKIPEMRSFLASYASSCEGAEILAYYRPSLHSEFYPMATQRVLSSGKLRTWSEFKFIDVRNVKTLTQTDCPIKAVAVLMPKRNDILVEDAMMLFTKVGLQESDLTEHRFGKGRNIVWTTP